MERHSGSRGMGVHQFQQQQQQQGQQQQPAHSGPSNKGLGAVSYQHRHSSQPPSEPEASHGSFGNADRRVGRPPLAGARVAGTGATAAAAAGKGGAVSRLRGGEVTRQPPRSSAAQPYGQQQQQGKPLGRALPGSQQQQLPRRGIAGNVARGVPGCRTVTGRNPVQERRQPKGTAGAALAEAGAAQLRAGAGWGGGAAGAQSQGGGEAGRSLGLARGRSFARTKGEGLCACSRYLAGGIVD